MYMSEWYILSRLYTQNYGIAEVSQYTNGCNQMSYSLEWLEDDKLFVAVLRRFYKILDRKM